MGGVAFGLGDSVGTKIGIVFARLELRVQEERQALYSQLHICVTDVGSEDFKGVCQVLRDIQQVVLPSSRGQTQGQEDRKH